MDLSTIKNTGNWGNSASRLNENFSKVGTEVDKLKYAAYNSKLYASEALLKQAIPSPSVGDWAIVGNSIPGEIYRCDTDGEWTATGQTGGGYGMEVTEKHVTEQYVTEVHNEYTGDIVNNPDDEDLISEEKPEGSKVLKLADKMYNASAFSGLGRVYLRKNVTASKNILTQAMISNANTRYIIQYDYDLNGQAITIPEGCVLDFQGGSISNGTIYGDSTAIVDTLNTIFGSNVTVSGSFALSGGWMPEWFGAMNGVDCTDALQRSLDAASDTNNKFVRLGYAVYNVSESLIVGNHVSVVGSSRDSSVVSASASVGRIFTAKNDDVTAKNITFRNFCIKGASLADYGIYLHKCEYVKLDRMLIYGLNECGVELGGYCCDINQCIIKFNAKKGLTFGGAGDNNNNNISQTQILGNAIGLVYTRGACFTMTGSDIEMNSKTGIVICSTTSPYLCGNYFEKNGETGFAPEEYYFSNDTGLQDKIGTLHADIIVTGDSGIVIVEYSKIRFDRSYPVHGLVFECNYFYEEDQNSVAIILASATDAKITHNTIYENNTLSMVGVFTASGNSTYVDGLTVKNNTSYINGVKIPINGIKPIYTLANMMLNVDNVYTDSQNLSNVNLINNELDFNKVNIYTKSFVNIGEKINGFTQFRGQSTNDVIKVGYGNIGLAFIRDKIVVFDFFAKANKAMTAQVTFTNYSNGKIKEISLSTDWKHFKIYIPVTASRFPGESGEVYLNASGTIPNEDYIDVYRPLLYILGDNDSIEYRYYRAFDTTNFTSFSENPQYVTYGLPVGTTISNNVNADKASAPYYRCVGMDGTKNIYHKVNAAGILFGEVPPAASDALAGTQYYNTISKNIVICNGTDWV